jgi:uncharacterized membrane protein
MLDVLINQIEEKSPEKGVIKVSDRADKPVKSIMKSISWRIVGTIDTMLISYFITGKLTFALSIGSIEVLTKTFLYYFHERLWAHIHRLKFNIFKRADANKIEARRSSKVVKRKNPGRIVRGTFVPVS